MVAKKRRTPKAVDEPFSLTVKKRRLTLKISNKHFQLALELPVAVVISLGALLGSPLIIDAIRIAFNVR